MTALAIDSSGLSHQEYFTFEEELDLKHEYIAGEIFSMAGGSVFHGLISKNTTTILDIALRNKPCTVFNSDIKLHINEIDSFFYPDAMVLCERGEISEKYIQSPEIIIEVLSPSTEDYDHGKKFSYYRLIPALTFYIMLHQDKPLAEVYQRCDDDSWLLREYSGLKAVITLNNDLQLALQDLYRQITFKE